MNIKFVRYDGEKGLGVEFGNLCAEEGIKLEKRVADTEEESGAIERAGKILIEKARAIARDANLPRAVHNEVLRTTGKLANMTPVEALGWKTPYELAYGRKPNASNLVPTGAKAFYLNRKIPRSHKLRSRALIGHHVGYEGSNIYRIWLPSVNRVIRTRDVVFNTQSFYAEHEAYAKEERIWEVINVAALPEH